jgi:hypothetical protein
METFPQEEERGEVVTEERERKKKRERENKSFYSLPIINWSYECGILDCRLAV